jgi:hypothetical protein
MFFLKPADGAIGGHTTVVKDCYRDFRDLARRIADRCKKVIVSSPSGTATGEEPGERVRPPAIIDPLERRPPSPEACGLRGARDAPQSELKSHQLSVYAMTFYAFQESLRVGLAGIVFHDGKVGLVRVVDADDPVDGAQTVFYVPSALCGQVLVNV